MTRGIGAFRGVLAAFALVTALAFAAPGPASAQQGPNSTNPTASSVREEDLLSRLQKL